MFPCAHPRSGFFCYSYYHLITLFCKAGLSIYLIYQLVHADFAEQSVMLSKYRSQIRQFFNANMLSTVNEATLEKLPHRDTWRAIRDSLSPMSYDRKQIDTAIQAGNAPLLDCFNKCFQTLNTNDRFVKYLVK